MENAFYKKGLAYLKKAKALANKGNYEEASKLYKLAYETLEKGYRFETNPLTKESFKLLMEEAYNSYQNCLKGNLPSTKSSKSSSTSILKVSSNPTNKEMKKDDNSEGEDFKKYVESLITKTNISWDDIGGLEEVKRLLKINYVLSVMKTPEAIKPWRGILFFGPPGTGKTLLASALAGKLNATFFNVPVSKVLSKYFGESPKIISSLYEVAREKSPSVVFIDEIDALTMSRDKEQSEASRKVLSTLLAEMDGLHTKDNKAWVLSLAATNTPWDLDNAVLRRFPIRIYIPLPDEEATKEIIKIHTKGLELDVDIDELAKKCVERLFSGAEIQSLCNYAKMNMVFRVNPDIERYADLDFDELKKKELKIDALRMEDFEEAFKKVKSPLTKRDIERYEKWAEEFGTKF
jgi:SpoVK/Ycf46/Vps4 family AAA+-type ATPase